jgi:hypothetical protein
MNSSVSTTTAPPSRLKSIFIRIISILCMATLIGIGLRTLAAALERSPEPAGFCRGAVQGALMPCALPNLLVGDDVTIYAARNTGRMYKLGYTCGVNVCGAFFFGMFFLRVSRWRRERGGPGAS